MRSTTSGAATLTWRNASSGSMWVMRTTIVWCVAGSHVVEAWKRSKKSTLASESSNPKMSPSHFWSAKRRRTVFCILSVSPLWRPSPMAMACVRITTSGGNFDQFLKPISTSTSTFPPGWAPVGRAPSPCPDFTFFTSW